MSLLRSEIATEAWRQRYVDGVCELDEMEAGVARALAGECSDAERVRLSLERQLGVNVPSNAVLTRSLLVPRG